MITKNNYLENTNTELNNLLVGKTMTHSKFGLGTIEKILSVDLDSNKTAAYALANIKFETETKQMALSNKFSKIMTVDCADFVTTMNSITDELINYQNVEDAEKAKLNEARKAAEDAKREEAKLEARRQKAIVKMQSTKITHITNNPNSAFYNNLGWLAKHISNISVVVPDFLEKSFRHAYELADDAKISVVDSKKKTTGGYAMKWSESIAVSFKIKKDEVIPVEISNRFANGKHIINSVDFACDLLSRYNFKVGKKQNVDEIRKIVPTDYIADFELGFAA